jgi:succinyl-CoA synthetase beta subunit
MHHLMERGTRQSPEALPAVKVQANPIPRGVLSEAESKAYLSAYGLPITGEAVVTGADAAIAAADRMGYPVAIKVSSAAIAHKSDVGGVVLNLPDADAVRNAVLDMDKKFPLMPVLVQQMVNPGLELIVGARRTPETGVVVMLGIGGVLTEILNDAIFFRAPASVATATDALNRLGSQRLLNGYRGAPAIDRDAVARIAATLSQIVAANPDIVEVDLNPVIAHSNGAVVVDALIRTEA